MKNQLRLRYHLTFAFAVIALVPILVMGVIQVMQLVSVMRDTENHRNFGWASWRMRSRRMCFSIKTP
ncbi:hypothetical protein KDJ56_16445 [Brevibacillus composti]|uniref:Uncharacterized protein n=1 Tax=Brevibacillus composti TaxID=2796470 RepID=A0A7T5EJ01_9BACL|nr:hypothetical protein [Brevibacillus composti]QQE73479.1 hypothetical protein JD108_16500 [Brevibacillus composti]QUO40561.1 hypothetical protein KDJ56_16445 [Brevibacillus composti]